MTEIQEQARPTIVYGVTIANSLDVLLRGQLAGMTARGWRVHAVAASGPAIRKVFEREQIEGIHTIEMTRRISPVQDLVALWRWIRLLRRLRPAVVNASTPKAGLLGMIAGWLVRVPTRVYIVRGARYETATGLSRRVMILLERVAVYCSTHAIVISPSLRDELRTSGIGRGRPLLLIGRGSSNGIPTAKLRAAYDRYPRRQSEGNGTFTVLFLGRFVRDKGVLVLADALCSDALSDTFLITAGDQEETLSSDALSRLRSESRWRQLAYVEDITSLFAQADVLVLPSYREGMGNVVLEASGVGLPVVGTTATGLRDAVVDGVTGFSVEPGNAQQLAAALTKLKQDPELRSRLGRAGQDWVHQNFSQPEIWDAYHGLYTGELQIAGEDIVLSHGR